MRHSSFGYVIVFFVTWFICNHLLIFISFLVFDCTILPEPLWMQVMACVFYLCLIWTCYSWRTFQDKTTHVLSVIFNCLSHIMWSRHVSDPYNFQLCVQFSFHATNQQKRKQKFCVLIGDILVREGPILAWSLELLHFFAWHYKHNLFLSFYAPCSCADVVHKGLCETQPTWAPTNHGRGGGSKDPDIMAHIENF